MSYSRSKVFLLSTALVLAAGCATEPQGPPPELQDQMQQAAAEADAKNQAAVRRYENLNATVWQQTAAEYDAVALQTYKLATEKLDAAIADPTWVAAVEQDAAAAEGKPPAIILDVDETVLDNSPYQARLIEAGESFDPKTWNAWAAEGKADPVPGALEFTKAAADKGVTVFYVTNRVHKVEEPTRKNLEALGFPMAEGKDVLLTKKERENWGSDKTPRRELIADEYRIIMLFGDNLGDFLARSDAQGEPAERTENAMNYESRWGQSWFMLPNPMYGYWEGAPYDYDYGKTSLQKANDKREALDTME